MYYILTSPVGPGNIEADFYLDVRFYKSWYTGSRFKVAPPNPLELTWDPDNEAAIRRAFYDAGAVLMLKDLVVALGEAGVDNLQTYPVVIKSRLGQPDCHDYAAVNVLGVIRAADLDKSVILDDPDDGMLTVMFESLAIDEKRAMGQLLFRLGESVSTVVIHERVVKHLRQRGGFGLTFVDPADYLS